MATANLTTTPPIASADEERRHATKKRIAAVFDMVLLICTVIGLVVLVALIIDLAIEGITWITPNLWENYHSRRPEDAGMRSAIAGSLFVVSMTGLLSFPVGVGAAIYLEEYAPKHPFTNFLNVNINNLAGVPSIIFGMLGLAMFARFFGLLQPTGFLLLLLTGEPASFFGLSIDLPFSIVDTLGWTVGERGGLEFRLLGLLIQLPFESSILAGALTMTLLALPTVIIAAREAVRAVPPSIREAAYGLGATRWQVMSRQVLPIALPGILTGMILALSRTIGETAPLLILGAYTYVPFLPASVWDRFTVMPIQIYNWISLPQEEYRFHLSAAAILILLSVLLSLNSLAVYLRNRFQIKW